MQQSDVRMDFLPIQFPGHIFRGFALYNVAYLHGCLLSLIGLPPGHFTPVHYRPVKNTSISFPLIFATVTGILSSASFPASFFASSSSRNKNTSSSKVSLITYYIWLSCAQRDQCKNIRIMSKAHQKFPFDARNCIRCLTHSSFISFAALCFSPADSQGGHLLRGYDCTTFPERTQSPDFLSCKSLCHILIFA